MASNNRLTKAVRESIIKDLLNYAFREQAQAQIDAECAFAHQVFDDVFPGFDEARAIFKDCYFPQDNDFKVAFGGEVRSLYFDRGFDYSVPYDWRLAGCKTNEERPKRRMPHYAYGNQAVSNFASDHPLTKRWAELVLARETLEEEMGKAKRTAEATLGSVTTIAKLIDVWPEARVFAERYKVDGEAKAILPAIPRAELNHTLGLPPSTSSASLAAPSSPERSRATAWCRRPTS